MRGSWLVDSVEDRFKTSHQPPTASHASFGFDSGRLRDLTPFFRLGLDERGVLGRAVARHLVADGFHLLPGLGVVERLGENAVDAIDNRPRRAGGDKHAVPVVTRVTLDA